jgi:DNA repair protein RecN (Recombination protein N)
MLSHISIKDFTIVESLELDLSKGFTAVTGETGAGKSIMLDALSLATGHKADGSQVRPGANKAEIYACFDLPKSPKSPVKKWLLENDLDGDQDQLILSRIITNEGRSRGYINGRPAPLQQLKDLGEHLVDIHGQHAHQMLLHKDSPRTLLDNYGNYGQLASDVKHHFTSWQKIKKQVERLQNQSDEVLARAQLLEYQVQEMDLLDLEENELYSLENEQKRMATAETHLLSAHQALHLCQNADDQTDAYQAIQYALQKLDSFFETSPALKIAHELLNQAYVIGDEACNELSSYIDGFEINPQRLQHVEERLNAIYELARKHKVRPEELLPLHNKLSQELAELKGQDQSLDDLLVELETVEQSYIGHAQALSSARKKTSTKLCKELLKQLKLLALDKAQVSFVVDAQPIHNANQYGLDEIQLLVSFNPGQPLQPLNKVASGGELSRVSLALQILIQEGPSTLIFDEIDVGVGGATAERMGRLLKDLGSNKQVISVTHQPQVAALAHHHLLVNKLSGKQQTRTQMRELGPDQRQQELARMMGGLEISDLTLAHAKDMLVAAQA